MDMETRMALIEEKYEQLDRRMESVETKLDHMSERMHEGQKGLIKTIYVTMAVFASVIISAFGVMTSLS
tara:strand:- start:810 stop:1016 length:207 start_codon:yes stop_codon:yes gene_type:complete